MITSTSNAQVKQLLALQKKSRERSQKDVFVVEGIKMYREVPRDRLVQTYVSEQFYRKNEVLFHGASDIIVLADHVFASVSDTKTPQGVLGLVRQYHYELQELLGEAQGQKAGIGQQRTGAIGARMGAAGGVVPEKGQDRSGGKLPEEVRGNTGPETVVSRPLVIILENLQDPGNLGTIVRTAEGAGVTGILLSADCVDIYNPKVIRSTMGSIYRVPFCYSRDLHADLARLKRQGVRLYAAHLKGRDFYDRFGYCDASGFLIGNESRGLTEETAALADTFVQIPMCGQVESLNAAVAASVLMYEANRQRRRAV